MDIRSSFWTGETGQRIRGTADAQLLALYAVTGPHANQTGLFTLTPAAIAHDLDFSPVAIRKAKTVLLDVGFMAWDDEQNWVWVFEMFRYQIGETMKIADKRNAGVQRYIDQHCKKPFIKDFIRKYGETHNLQYREPKPPPIAPPGPKLLFDIEPEPAEPTAAELLGDMKPIPVNQGLLIREVINHYRTYFPGRFKAINPGAIEWRHIAARLNEGVTVDEMKKAIDGMMRDPFHQGQNDRRRKYDSLELVTRSSRKIHELIEVPIVAGPVLSAKNSTTVSAIQARRQRREAAESKPEGSAGMPHDLDPFHPSLRDDYDESQKSGR